MLDGLHDQKHRIERLESCMPGNGHVQFGGGPMEQGNCCTSPAAYPTRSSPNFGAGGFPMEQNVASSISCWSAVGSADGSRHEASNELTPRTCWQLFARSVAWNVWERRCVMRGVLLAEVAPAWLLEHMDAEWAERYQKRFSDFRLPKDATERVALAETIGADGRRLFERVDAETSLPWLRELDAVETLRRVWLQHYHASEFGTPWRADGELPPSALLITSPYDFEARYSRKKSTTWTGYKVHFTPDV
jgi:hypothetical protein